MTRSIYQNILRELVKTYQNADGDQLAVPKDIDTCAVWYNKKMFDEAGIDYPTADWTWDDFREVAKGSLQRMTEVSMVLQSNRGSYQESWYSTIYAYGGEVLLLQTRKNQGFDEAKNN